MGRWNGVEQGAKEKLRAMSILRKTIEVFMGMEGLDNMSKRELIDYICEINRTARTDFLAMFSEDDLKAYLEHLMELDLEEILVCA